MRKVFLDDLPRWGNGTCKGKINWKESKGETVKGYYNDLYFEIKILDYNSKNRKLLVQYLEDEPKEIRSSDFYSGKIGRVLNLISNEFKYKIGDNIIDNKRNLIITECKKIKNKKFYKIKCLECGFDSGEHYKNGNIVDEYWVLESNIKQYTCCPCCGTSPKIVVENINSMNSKSKWMVDLGVDLDYAKRYTSQSETMVKCNCPNCGNVIYKKPTHIYKNRSIGCVCGDGFSYPEKLMYAILKELEVDFETQYSPKYLGMKRSDFYLPDYKLVIETDGRLGHEGGYVLSASNTTLNECINSDREKDELHREKGIKTIRINCFQSDLVYIKNSITKSELNRLFDLSNINWIKCDDFAIKFNLAKNVCEYWNYKKDNETTKDLSKIFKVSVHTVIRYLKKGTKNKWCVYDAKLEKYKGNSKSGKMNSKKVEIFKNGLSLGVYPSATELERISFEKFGVKLLVSNISYVISGRYKQHKGFTFKYVE